jgi:hypothetical protein
MGKDVLQFTRRINRSISLIDRRIVRRFIQEDSGREKKRERHLNEIVYSCVEKQNRLPVASSLVNAWAV